MFSLLYNIENPHIYLLYSLEEVPFAISIYKLSDELLKKLSLIKSNQTCAKAQYFQ